MGERLFRLTYLYSGRCRNLAICSVATFFTPSRGDTTRALSGSISVHWIHPPGSVLLSTSLTWEHTGHPLSKVFRFSKSGRGLSFTSDTMSRRCTTSKVSRYSGGNGSKASCTHRERFEARYSRGGNWSAEMSKVVAFIHGYCCSSEVAQILLRGQQKNLERSRSIYDQH
jgi:hypothetical protein